MGKGAFSKTDKGWMIDTKVKVDGEWKHFVKRGYPTLQAAKADFETAKENFILKNQKHHKVAVFNDLLEDYYTFRSLKIGESTLYVEKCQMNKYILSAFNNKLIKNVIDYECIRAWYQNLLKDKSVKDNKKNKIFLNMKQLLKYAYSKKYIDAEVYQDCDTEIMIINDNDEHKKKTIWSNDEETKFFEAVKENPIDDLMFRLLFLCATRIGEFVGLQVKCFDYEKNQIKIFQQVKQTEEGIVLSNKLKSEHSYRIILISQDISNRLKEYIDTFGLTDDDFLWYGSTTKKPVTKNTIRRKLFYYCDKAGIERIVPHAVRHNMAVKLANGCETSQDIEICASRLGHAPSVFLNIYANHTSVSDQEKLMKKILNI